MPFPTIPNEYFCPITLEIMDNPVITADGKTYERTAIKEWFKTKNTSPITNLILANKWLIPNLALRTLIQDFREIQKQETILNNPKAFHTLIQYRYFSKSELLAFSAPALNELLTHWEKVATFFNQASNPKMTAILKFNLRTLEPSALNTLLSYSDEVIQKLVVLMRCTDTSLMYLLTLQEQMLNELLSRRPGDISLLTQCAHIPLLDFVKLDKKVRDFLCSHSYVVKALVNEGNVTHEQLPTLLEMDSIAAFELNNPSCLHALRDEKTTLELLADLSYKEITLANRTGEYPCATQLRP